MFEAIFLHTFISDFSPRLTVSEKSVFRFSCRNKGQLARVVLISSYLDGYPEIC